MNFVPKETIVMEYHKTCVSTTIKHTKILRVFKLNIRDTKKLNSNVVRRKKGSIMHITVFYQQHLTECRLILF